jgi:prepilin-type N-terminal cleavage/methylation domain-containing protein
MKKAFTIIELIFVIVVIGILTAIALPKFSGIQDEALITSEKAGINSIKNVIAVLHGQMMLHGGDINQTVLRADGSEVEISIASSKTNYPQGLCVDFANKTVYTDKAPTKPEEVLSIALSIDSRGDYKVSKGELFDTYFYKYKIVGPASSKITNKSAKYNIYGSWEYNTKTGTLLYRDNVAF